MGGRQPHRIPRKPRDRSKIKHLEIIIRLIRIYKRLFDLTICPDDYRDWKYFVKNNDNIVYLHLG